MYAFALLFQEGFKILKFNKLCFLSFFLLITNYLFQTYIQRYLSEKYQQHSEIETSVNVSVDRTFKNCQLELGNLFNTAYFAANEGLSFRKYPKLCCLQSKNDIVLGKNYLTDVVYVADLFYLSANLRKITLGNPSTQHVIFRFCWTVQLILESLNKN